MGMSASQARMLSLTARMSDLELSAQSISNSKIRLADQSEAASREYSEALNKQKFSVKSFSNGETSYIDATAYNLTHYQAISDMDKKQRFIKDAAGRVLVDEETGKAYDSAGGELDTFLNSLIPTDPMQPDYDKGKVDYYTKIFNEIQESGGYNSPGDDNLKDSEWLQAQADAGNVFLVEYDTKAGADGKGDYVDVSWTSGDANIQEKDDKTMTAKAEAEYETTMASIQAKDKRFDLQLKEIDTEHQAITQEIDSVKQVINKNIERSFKIFNG